MTNVLTVDAGDAIQGNAIGLASKGEAIINIMNVVGYDFATFGNHEFDYGLQNLRQLLDIANAQYLCCNIDYAGEDATFINHFSPYIIKQYGKINLAFIGALTPDTQKISIVDSNNAERNLYNFYEKDSGKALYQKIQDTVNECRSLGADYIILLAHLGTTDSVYSSYAVAANTESIDIIIDGHSHSVIEDEVVKNSLGKDVHITSTGSHFKNFGKLLISPQGKFSFSLISAGAYKKQDSSVAQCIKNEKSKTEDLLNAIVAKSNKTLDYTNSKNERIILKEETALGDFCADAFRLTSNADIALINAGGIRSGIVEGNITNKDLYSVFPFGNLLCTAHIRGDKILEALEYAYSFLPNASKTFLQVSGISFDVDLSCSPRVQNVKVLQDKKYIDIESKKFYTVTSNNFLLQTMGDGFTMFKDIEVFATGRTDSDALKTYLVDYLHGNLDLYTDVDSRINILENIE